MEVTFVRHGETNSYVDGFIETQFNYGLNKKGERECERSKFADDSFDRVYSSPYLSAKQTAGKIYPYQKYIVNWDVRRGYLGKLDNADGEGYPDDYLENVRKHIVDPIGAESAKKIIARLDRFFDLLKECQKVDDRILVVTHNDILKLIKSHYFTNVVEEGRSNGLARCKYILKK